MPPQPRCSPRDIHYARHARYACYTSHASHAWYAPSFDGPTRAQVLLLIDTYRDLLLGCELFRLLDNQTVVRLLERLEPCTFLPNQVIR